MATKSAERTLKQAPTVRRIVESEIRADKPQSECGIAHLLKSFKWPKICQRSLASNADLTKSTYAFWPLPRASLMSEQVTDSATVTSTMDQVNTDFGRIDIVVANAGMIAAGPVVSPNPSPT